MNAKSMLGHGRKIIVATVLVGATVFGISGNVVTAAVGQDDSGVTQAKTREWRSTDVVLAATREWKTTTTK
jgi:hypothetical protein